MHPIVNLCFVYYSLQVAIYIISDAEFLIAGFQREDMTAGGTTKCNKIFKKYLAVFEEQCYKILIRIE